MKTRKRKKRQPPQHPVQRVVMTINFNYVKTEERGRRYDGSPTPR